MHRPCASGFDASVRHPRPWRRRSGLRVGLPAARGALRLRITLGRGGVRTRLARAGSALRRGIRLGGPVVSRRVGRAAARAALGLRLRVGDLVLGGRRPDGHGLDLLGRQPELGERLGIDFGEGELLVLSLEAVELAEVVELLPADFSGSGRSLGCAIGLAARAATTAAATAPPPPSSLLVTLGDDLRGGERHGRLVWLGHGRRGRRCSPSASPARAASVSGAGSGAGAPLQGGEGRGGDGW